MGRARTWLQLVAALSARRRDSALTVPGRRGRPHGGSLRPALGDGGLCRFDSARRSTRARTSGAANCSRRAAGRRSRRRRRLLTPLLLATQRGQRPLTPSGFYYVPLSFGFSSYGPAVFALHVADGSEIITRHVGGPSLSVYVGDGRERYGSCTERLHPARLAEGYLPIVQTSYVDAKGVKYTQESFVGRAYGARSVVSFVKLARRRARGALDASVRLVPWKLLAHSAPDRLAYRGDARLIVERRRTSSSTVSFGTASRRETRRRSTPSGSTARPRRRRSTPTLRPTTPRDRRSSTTGRPGSRPACSSTCPSRPFSDAALGVLAQVLAFGWRYSVGNPYEELSFAEALDSAEVARNTASPTSRRRSCRSRSTGSGRSRSASRRSGPAICSRRPPSTTA